MTFTLSITCDNAAFGTEDEPQERRDEIARILRAAANKIENGYDKCGLRDGNGNIVGKFDTKTS